MRWRISPRPQGEYVEPISTSYRGAEIFQMPPNNQGITALLMLNILAGFDLGKLDPLSAERLHLEIEAGRLAYRDRNALIGDPRHAAIKSKEILAKDYADKLRGHINRDRAISDLPSPIIEHSDTVYLCVVDRDRNAVSLINSTYHSFGSGVVAPKSGVILQNRGSSFRLDPQHPNAIAPGKRPMHTIMPGMAVKDGKAWMPYGVMGGDYQPFGHVHLLTNILDFGMDPQAALDCARVFYDGGNVEVEHGIPEQAVAVSSNAVTRRWKPLNRWAAARRSRSTPGRHADRRLRSAQGWLRARLLRLTGVRDE